MKLKLQKERKKREEYQANSQIYNNKQKRLIYITKPINKNGLFYFLKKESSLEKEMHILILTKKYTNIFFEKKNTNINKINSNISNLVFISPNKESRNIINASITQSRRTPSSISPKHKIKSLGPY
ncbi:hypothetical protein ACB098_12G040000 [Castanea mollissima]